MVEIKVEMTPEIPAQEARPAEPKRYTATVDGYEVGWTSAAHCYPPGWSLLGRIMTPAAFRKFASIFNNIADTLEEKEKNNGT